MTNYYQNALIFSCSSGNFELVQWLFSIAENNQHDLHKYYNMMFQIACGSSLDIAKWLLGRFAINFEKCKDMAFKKACGNGNLEIARWLYYEIGNGSTNLNHQPNKLFITVIEKGDLEMAKWLYSLGGIETELQTTIVNAVRKGHFSIALWLHQTIQNTKHTLSS
jgi:hypothetical protein